MHDWVKSGMREEYRGRGGNSRNIHLWKAWWSPCVPETEKNSYERLHICTHHTRFVMQSFTFYCSWQVILRRQRVSYFRPQGGSPCNSTVCNGFHCAWEPKNLTFEQNNMKQKMRSDHSSVELRVQVVREHFKRCPCGLTAAPQRPVLPLWRKCVRVLNLQR